MADDMDPAAVQKSNRIQLVMDKFESIANANPNIAEWFVRRHSDSGAKLRLKERYDQLWLDLGMKGYDTKLKVNALKAVAISFDRMHPGIAFKLNFRNCQMEEFSNFQTWNFRFQKFLESADSRKS